MWIVDILATSFRINVNVEDISVILYKLESAGDKMYLYMHLIRQNCL
jgi:hypothetical protein